MRLNEAEGAVGEEGGRTALRCGSEEGVILAMKQFCRSAAVESVFEEVGAEDTTNRTVFRRMHLSRLRISRPSNHI